METGIPLLSVHSPVRSQLVNIFIYTYGPTPRTTYLTWRVTRLINHQVSFYGFFYCKFDSEPPTRLLLILFSSSFHKFIFIIIHVSKTPFCLVYVNLLESHLVTSTRYSSVRPHSTLTIPLRTSGCSYVLPIHITLRDFSSSMSVPHLFPLLNLMQNLLTSPRSQDLTTSSSRC